MEIVMGHRMAGTSYAEQYKDKALWSLYEDAGFHEQKNTRVLFVFTLELDLLDDNELNQ